MSLPRDKLVKYQKFYLLLFQIKSLLVYYSILVYISVNYINTYNENFIQLNSYLWKLIVMGLEIYSTYVKRKITVV